MRGRFTNKPPFQPNELPQPTIKDTALYRMPIWFYGLTVGRVLSKKEEGSGSEDDDDVADDDYKEVNAADTDDSEPGRRTPSTGSADDGFELLDKSVEDLGKATGSQAQQKQGKSGKRKGKKR